VAAVVEFLQVQVEVEVLVVVALGAVVQQTEALEL
tara:strand:+ start:714 stop:818 length:105 start_codon:yes stop_codon:yes gene_type:complete